MPTLIFHKLSLYDNQQHVRHHSHVSRGTHVVMELIFTSCPSFKSTLGLIPDTWARASIVVIFYKSLFSCDLCFVVCAFCCVQKVVAKLCRAAHFPFMCGGVAVSRLAPPVPSDVKWLNMTRRKMTGFGNSASDFILYYFYLLQLFGSSTWLTLAGA